ncbi:MAG: L,D-transpeptidase family protein [Litoreibacter sp.]|nr:L,D-transpeptidase family protein [Litoreibacter sp.]
MTSKFSRRAALRMLAASVAGAAVPMAFSGSAAAASTALKQSIAMASARDRTLAQFYKARDYEPIFVGSSDRRRRTALIKAFAGAGDHGLPVDRYEEQELRDLFRSAKGADARGKAEIVAAQKFLAYADDIGSGILNPRRIDKGLVMKVARYDQKSLLAGFAQSNPKAFLNALPPQSRDYVRLQKEKLRLEKLLGKGGWGKKVAAKSLKPGAGGDPVVDLRNRLIRMGFMRKSSSKVYDAKLEGGVRNFQAAHGLAADGVAGAQTMAQVNKQVEDRLAQVIVALERRRWNNTELARNYVWVNIPDYHVDLYKGGKSVFRSRVVVGQNSKDRRTPEFSDTMRFMVVNPSWYVPRSIITKEYLPLLQEDPTAVSQLQLTDDAGRIVSRQAVDFTQYNEEDFPFSMKEPPNRGNALGLVKFMFPNRHNIYLHDTPSKNLFSRQRRAFSHGCIRVHKPFDFAYALLKSQVNDPKGYFQRALSTRKEAQIDLKEPLPVHLVYYTAWVDQKGAPQYRNDVYGRDKRIFGALAKAGVSLRAVRS